MGTSIRRIAPTVRVSRRWKNENIWRGTGNVVSYGCLLVLRQPFIVEFMPVFDDGLFPLTNEEKATINDAKCFPE